MSKIKVTYILSSIDKAIAFEWIVQNINNPKIDLSFILLNNKKSYLYKWLQKNNIEAYYINHSGKKTYPKSFLKVLKILRSIRPKVVHTHLFDANLIGLSCAKLLGVKKRIYTRHHSTYHHDNFPKAVKYDKWSNWLATDIVAISKNVKDVLINLENVNEHKITLIHHGFDLDKFKNPNLEEVKNLKEKYKINNSPTIGVVARYINLKGHKYIIEAFIQVLKKYPKAILILANATGPNKKEIRELLTKIPKENYREIAFEPNLFALYKLFDVYVHVPIDSKIEAFGQTYVEALAAGVPSVFTLSGVANEFVEDKKNALVVDYKNSEEIQNAVLSLLENNILSERLIKKGEEDIKSFNLNSFIKKLETLYI